MRMNRNWLLLARLKNHSRWRMFDVQEVKESEKVQQERSQGFEEGDKGAQGQDRETAWQTQEGKESTQESYLINPLIGKNLHLGSRC